MRKSLIAFLSILMIFAVACASQPAEPAQTSQQPPQTQQPAQTEQTAEKPVETSKTVSVAIMGFKFVPADVTVNVGDTVIWTNEDSAPHTVESSDSTLRSDELSKGDTYSYKFTKAGKYNYICGIHTSMQGSVMVQ